MFVGLATNCKTKYFSCKILTRQNVDSKEIRSSNQDRSQEGEKLLAKDEHLIIKS